MSNTEIRITLVICTHNRRESLLQTLETVATQQCSVPWEVLVVDNAGTDGTLAAVSALVANFPAPLRVIREATQGRSYALNHAIEAANGGVLIFTDDDVNLRPGFVAAHSEVYADPTVGGAGGRILPIMPANTPAWMLAMAERGNGGLAGRYDWGDAPREISVGSDVHLPYGANMSLRKEIAAELGGFRTDLGWGKTFVPGEENELFERVQQQGFRVLYQPAAAVEHRFQPAKASLEYFLRYEAGYGRGQVLTAGLTAAARVRWILRNLRDLAVHWVRATVAPHDVAERIEHLRQQARARGRLAQLLCL